MKYIKKFLFVFTIILSCSTMAKAQMTWDKLSSEVLNGLDGGVHMPSITATAFINGTTIYYVSDDEGVQEGDLSQYDGGLPAGWSSLTGAARWNDTTIMLFNGNEYALFDLDQVSIAYRGPFPNIPANVDSVSNWGDSQILFFSGSEYVIYDRDDQSVSQPAAITDFGNYELGTPDAVVNGDDGFIYFFRAGKFQALEMASQSFGEVVTLVSSSGSLPPVATNTSLPPVGGGSLNTRTNDTPPVSSRPEPRQEEIAEVTSGFDTSGWCLVGVPTGNSDADLVSDETPVKGSDSGDSLEDDAEQGTRVVEMRVWGGRVVSGMQTVLQNEDGEMLELPVLGTKKGRMQNFIVPEGDCIIGVDGQFGGDYGQFIHNITFVTSGGRSKKIGGPGKKAFKLRLDSGVSFYGFKVHHTNNISGIALKYVGFEGDMPEIEIVESSPEEEATSIASKYKGKYADDHEKIYDDIMEAQGYGGSEYVKRTLPSVEWLGRGVDYVYLDPLDIMDVNQKLPRKKQMFTLITSKKVGGLEGDNFIPFGTDFIPLGSRLEEVSKQWTETYSDFTTNFGVGVGVSVGTPIGGGSLSTSFSQMNNSKIGRSEVYFSRNVGRTIYQLIMFPDWQDDDTGEFKRQKLKFGFRTAIDNLPVPASVPRIDVTRMSKNKKLPSQIERLRPAYEKIIQEYGTHFMVEVVFGGKYVSTTVIKKEDYENTRQSEVDFKASASAQIKAVEIGGDVSFNYGTKSVVGRKSGTLNTRSYVQGGAGKDYEGWDASLEKLPVPIRVKLTPTYELLTDIYWPNDPEIKKKHDLLKIITEQYQVDNDVQIKNNSGGFFSNPKAIDYTYTMTVTGIKCTAVNDAKLDGAANVYGYIRAGYLGDLGENVKDVWRISKASSVDIRKGGMEPLTEKIEVVGSGEDLKGGFVIRAKFEDALTNGMAGVGKLIGDFAKEVSGSDGSYGYESMSILFSDITETPKEYKLRGFNFEGTKLEIIVTVSKTPDYAKNDSDD